MTSQQKTDPQLQKAARDAGLVYTSDSTPGITRIKTGKTFRYLDPGGKPLKEKKALARIKALVIPPAWQEVWISTRENGHLQVTGRDARGRKQYRYHADFRAHREGEKYEHMLDFTKALPSIRQRIHRDMLKRSLVREKVLATVIYLLEATLIRIGNADYAKQNKSYGLTTLRNEHVDVTGSRLLFKFKGKSGKVWSLQVSDRRIAKIVRDCQDLPGQELFGYLHEDGSVRDVTSSDINAYLKEISGLDITAKDFRTWNGTVLAALALAACETASSPTALKKNITNVVKQVAARLGNTPAICRKCYIHPAVVQAYTKGELGFKTGRLKVKIRTLKGLSSDERALITFLRRRA